MLGITFYKATPTTYVLHYRRGAVAREGAGLSFFYFAPVATIVAVPVNSTDLPFIFTEITADFQTVTVQGQLTYRVGDPKRLAALLDFSLAPDGSYRSEDPAKLKERLVGIVQELTRDVIRATPLREALTICGKIAAGVQAGLKSSEPVALCGLEILGLVVTAVTPTPDMARALEAEMRESLQRDADRAIYDRRNAAVEQERRIRESELNTELAVEAKKRQIRESQMQAEVALEEQRAVLVEKRSRNERADADTRAYALEAVLRPVRATDWKTLMTVTPGALDPRLSIAVAFRELAENAGKIGELTITPDLLNQLLRPPETAAKPRHA